MLVLDRQHPDPAESFDERVSSLVGDVTDLDCMTQGGGRADAETLPDLLDAVMAIVHPIVECNRSQIDNGRTYLREMVFGDPQEPRHGEALAIVAKAEEAIAAVLRRDKRVAEREAATLAHIVSAVMFLSMAVSMNVGFSVEEIVQDIRRQVEVVLPR